MKNIIKPVKGTRDFYPTDMALRTWLYRKIRKVSESFGYQEYEGPMLESIELYAAKSGEELVKEQAFVFPDKSGDLITLRPELTPTLARMVAQKQQQLIYPLRWWSFGPMWRYERPQKGRTREFFQWNIDLIGLDTPEADAEMVSIGASLMKEFGLTPDEVMILVNNRKLMVAELIAIQIPREKQLDVFKLIDRRDKMSPRSWETYALDIGLSNQQLDDLIKLLGNATLWEKSAELRRFFSTLDALGFSEYAHFAPYVIRGLDYYTGTVFECYDVNRDFRAIFAGGRYDNLVADVGGTPLPAVGFAMGDKVIQLVLGKFSRVPETEALLQLPVLMTIFNEESLLASYRFATNLRQAGIDVGIYPEPVKIKKQLKYADRIGARLVLMLGPDEQAKQAITIKDLNSRNQITIPQSDAPTAIRKLLERQNPS